MKKNWAKYSLGALLVAAILLVVFSGVSGHVSIETLKAKRELLTAWRNTHPLVVAVLYFFGYVFWTALAIPGATVFTLSGGLLFGLWWGTLMVSLASTVGATFACFIARYYFRDWIQNRFKDNLVDVNRGFKRDGVFYLLSLRLIPLFPYFMVNLLMGVLPIGLFTFFWVSEIGMLPATFLYVNAGTHLAHVNAVHDIFSPGVILSLVLLGFIPMLGQWLFKLARRTPKPSAQGNVD